MSETSRPLVTVSEASEVIFGGRLDERSRKTSPWSVLTGWVTRDIVSARGHHFLARGLGPDAVVLDLGAHKGEFSKALCAIGCRCVAVEANPVLSKCIAPSERLTVISGAIDVESGSRAFFVHENPEASSLQSTDDPATRIEQIRTFALPDVFLAANIDHAHLVKIDIEGTEVAMLNSLPKEILRRCDQITVEFHDLHSQHISTADVERVIQRLEACGCYAMSFSRGYTDVLFVRCDTALLRPWEVWYVKACLRYLLAFGRRLARSRIPRRKS